MYILKPRIKSLMILVLTFGLSQNLFSYTFTWNGITSTVWNLSTNWTRTGTGTGNTTPGASDVVVISNGSAGNQPSLHANLTITDLNVSAGNLNLNGFTLTATNDGFLTGGTVRNGTLKVVDYQSMQAMTFIGPLTITKSSGGGSNDLNGGNTFNGDISIINLDNSRFRLANITGDDFNGNMIFQQNSTGNLEPARNGNNTFAANISTVGTGTAIRFGMGTGIVIIDGNTTQNLSADVSTQPSIDEMTINTTGTLVLSQSLLINDDVVFTNGIIVSSSSNPIIFDNNAVASGVSNTSHVNGPVRKLGNTNNFDFPTGNGSIYAPISISSLSGGVSTNYFTAQYYKSVNGNASSTMGTGLDHVSTNEYWTLDRTGSVQAYVTLSYNSSNRSGPIGDATILRVAHWNGSNWGDEGRWSSSSTSTSSGTIRTLNRLTSFSPFTLGSASTLNPLPILLLDFRVRSYSSSEVTLDWKTSNEQSNAYFTVERSQDGYNWTSTGRVEGYGNSQDIRDYSFTDRKAAAGLSYYRLRMTDINGESSFSRILTVNISPIVSPTIVYPNPSNGILNLEVTGSTSEAKIALYDLTGKEVATWKKQTGSIINLDISSFDKGVYQLKVEVDGAITQMKVIKQ